MKEINIEGRTLSPRHPPFIVAEMSGNHNQSLERALKIVEAAAKAGADALKIQTYTADTMTLDVDMERFVINDPKSLWKGKSLYHLYQEAHTPWEWHKPIFDRCHELGLIGFSTPFDSTAVDLLESLGVPAYKIASFELTDHDLISRCANTGKPIIMSTGMASIAEVAEAVDVVRKIGNDQILLLKCTSAYPAPPEEINLSTIPHMAQAFGVLTGLSDHTLGTAVSVAAAAVGAVLIEKHFTLARSDGGVDSTFSLEPRELARLVEETRIAHAAVGQVRYTPGKRETVSKRYRRSLYFVRDLPAGRQISERDVKALRPGDGLAPKYLEMVVGRALAVDVTKGTPVSWDLLR